jgi:hypothetical protein
MRHFRPIRTGSFVTLFTLLALLNFSAPVSPSTDFRFPNPGSEISAATPSIVSTKAGGPSAQSLSGNSTYYTVRRDLRRCASPLCGGFFVKRVNHLRTRCANRQNMDECYVAEIDWNGQTSGEARQLLVRGDLLERRYPRFGRLGVVRVTESWRAVTERAPEGTFYRVKDLGIRCITYPCLTHQEERLNSYGQRKIAGVELNGAHAPSASVTEAQQAMTSADGILVAGTRAMVFGPAGRAITLRATQFYLRGSGPVATKPCIKTGCGGQVCSDEEVFTTCEWRPEHECYRRARCERQANGECGFTQTRELTACLRRR